MLLQSLTVVLHSFSAVQRTVLMLQDTEFLMFTVGSVFVILGSVVRLWMLNEMSETYLICSVIW